MFNKLKVDNRFVLFMTMLFVFVLWLAFFAVAIFYVLNHPDMFDAAMGMFTGLGLGAVTGFFTAMLTLSWQFYFRKKEEAEQVTTATTPGA